MKDFRTRLTMGSHVLWGFGPHLVVSHSVKRRASESLFYLTNQANGVHCHWRRSFERKNQANGRERMEATVTQRETWIREERQSVRVCEAGQPVQGNLSSGSTAIANRAVRLRLRPILGCGMVLFAPETLATDSAEKHLTTLDACGLRRLRSSSIPQPPTSPSL